MHVRVVRSGLVESRHSVSVVACSPDGARLLASGDVDVPFYLRSTAKPFQAAVATEYWNPSDRETLAVACASHDALPVHVSLIERLLASVGLDESALATPPAWPSNRAEADRQVTLGALRPRSIWHNCSGKHAAMLAACVRRRWPVEGYTDPNHPLQRAIAQHMMEAFGPDTLPVGVDGCGAPVFRATTRTMARGFARLLSDARYERVVDAMSSYPVLTSGPGNVDASIAIWLSGVAKRGAEGTLGVALPGRGVIAIKVWDGAERAVAPAAAAVLSHLGWIPRGSAENLESALTRRVFGGGEAVGTVEARLENEQP